jgi:hypothetical protein
VVGRLTLPRVAALYAEFRRVPPTRRLIAAFVGWKTPGQRDAPEGIDVRRLCELAQGSVTLDMLKVLF